MNILPLLRVWTRAAGVLVTGLIVVAGNVWSQEQISALRPAPEQPIVRGVQGDRVQNDTRSGPVRSSCNPNYWIVSARCCNDQLECGLDCNYQAFRFDGHGPGRQGNLQELYASLHPGIPVCIMIHGSFVVWDSVLRDSAETYCWLRNTAPERPVQLIFFTWPSDEAVNLLPHAIDTADARRLARRAELNAIYLADLVSRVPDTNPICLVGHSHGARMVAGTLHLLGGGTVEGRCFKGGTFNHQRIRAVLAAAAMDHDWFNPGERYDRALCRAESLMNVKSQLDLPLLFHPTHQLFASRALGRTGFTMLDQMRLGPHHCRIAECDVTSIIGCRHLWEHYYREPAIACAIRHYVYFDERSLRPASVRSHTAPTLAD